MLVPGLGKQACRVSGGGCKVILVQSCIWDAHEYQTSACWISLNE